jgi:[ribosomal protein S5]-alanine N-acetyltransferase
VTDAQTSTLSEARAESPIPTLESERLIMRGMTLDDAKVVQRLAGDKQIAATTLSIPHPYEDDVAEKWISSHAENFQNGREIVWAITLRETTELIGAIGLILSLEHSRAELGYWVGVPFWNKGYTTEAGYAVLRFAFEEMNLHRAYAHHLDHNPASGRVLQKLGMKPEGVLRQHISKWDHFYDIVNYGILREEFKRMMHEKSQR